MILKKVAPLFFGCICGYANMAFGLFAKICLHILANINMLKPNIKTNTFGIVVS